MCEEFNYIVSTGDPEKVQQFINMTSGFLRIFAPNSKAIETLRHTIIRHAQSVLNSENDLSFPNVCALYFLSREDEHLCAPFRPRLKSVVLEYARLIPRLQRLQRACKVSPFVSYLVNVHK